MDKKSTKKDQSKPTVALSPTLAKVPAVEGVEELMKLQRAYSIIPDAAAEAILADIEALRAVLVDSDITTYELATRAANVVSMLTGVPAKEVTQYHRTEVAERVHTYRNLCLAVAALAAATIGVRSNGTHPETIYAHAISLKRRSVLTRRPLTDDEIVLCRVAAHLAARTDPRNQAATLYTLLDAGEAPSETSHVAINDFDDPKAPQHLVAAGNGHLEERFLPLDQWSSHLLGLHMAYALRAGHPVGAPLTYKARPPRPGARKPTGSGSQSAAASAQRTIDRFLAQLNIPTGDITASSITQWRVATTLRTRGIDAAREISGRTDAGAMLRALGERTDAPTPTKPDDDGLSFAA